jgi:mitochondrial fission protein ELM1
LPEAAARGTADSKPPLVWLLMGTRAGDNNQLHALVDALGWPFEDKRIRYNALRHFRFLRSGLTIVARKSRPLIHSPWPDLVLCVGYGSVPVARYIRGQTGGRAKLVHIGNPRDKVRDFDLQITNPQYARAAPNLLELPFPIGNPAKDVQATADELEWLASFPRPRRLIAVGGPARHWRLDHAALTGAIETLRTRKNGSLIVATSARTTEETSRLLESATRGPHETIVDRFPRFAVLLAECDEIYVTADSVSMLSEAVLTGKPVGMIPIRHSARGLLSHWLWERPFGQRSFPDFPNFWRMLHRDKLVGTVEHPVTSRASDTIEHAVRAVRGLMSESAIGRRDR